MDALAVTGITKTFRPFRARPVEALRGVDLSVAPGRIFGLIGPNGAGKTTLVKILLGLVFPTTGRAEILGRDARDPESRRSVGYLPENAVHPDYLTPLEGLAFSADMAGCPAAGRGAEATALLERVGMAHAANRKIGTFSKGMRQRYGLAQALVGRPSVLVLDEPTDGVDPVGRAEIRTILFEERRRGATIFLNSHLLAEAERTCDDVAILFDGRVLHQGTMEAIVGARGAYVVDLVPGDGAGPLPEGLSPTGERANRYRFTSADLGELNVCLDRARAAGYLIASVASETAGLEEAFLAALREER